MTKLLLAGVLLGSGAAAASAQSQPTQFRGNACIQAVSSACAPVGVTRGTCYEARLRPANFNGGPNSTKISFFQPAFAMNFTLPTGTLVGSTFKTVNAVGLGQSATPYTAQARIPALAPTAPVSSTYFASAIIDINGFDSEAPLCNVTLYFQGQRFPF